MKNYQVDFMHEKGFSDYAPETMYFTEKGLNEFLERLEKNVTFHTPYIEWSKHKDGDIYLGDFYISIKEYETPKEPIFIDSVNHFENFEARVCDGGYDDTSFTIDMW